TFPVLSVATRKSPGTVMEFALQDANGIAFPSLERGDLLKLSATELAARLAGGEVSAVEVLEQYLERIERLEPQLGAVAVRCFDAARRDAEARDREMRARGPIGPLHGVPVSIKECFHVMGTPSCLGLPV